MLGCDTFVSIDRAIENTINSFSVADQGSRIKGARTTDVGGGGGLPIIWHKFSGKLHESEKNWTEMRPPHLTLDPPIFLAKLFMQALFIINVVDNA